MSVIINKTPSGTLRYPSHRHRQYEIMHYIKGQGVMWTENGEIPFSEGTVVIIPPNLLHGSVSENEFVNISIEYDFNGLLAFDSSVIISMSERDEGAQLVRMIWENRFGNEAYLHSLCIAYVQYILQSVDIKNSISACVKKIMMKISESAFNPEINASEILRESGYAEDYIRMCFKKETGRTPLAFLTELRIKHACYLIDIYGDSLSLSEIAERCGYIDYIYFSKKFKKQIGVSPCRYRELR